MTNILIRVIEFIVILFWVVIGPIFWLPFLVRMLAVFVCMVIASSSDDTDIRSAQIGLDKAIRFFPNGFKIIQQTMDAIINKSVAQDSQNQSKKSEVDFWEPLAIHVTYVIIFWGLAVYGIAMALR